MEAPKVCEGWPAQSCNSCHRLEGGCSCCSLSQLQQLSQGEGRLQLLQRLTSLHGCQGWICEWYGRRHCCSCVGLWQLPQLPRSRIQEPGRVGKPAEVPRLTETVLGFGVSRLTFAILIIIINI